MKSCSICRQNYTDENLNYCLNDGGLLIEMKDDAPPTIQMNHVRTTRSNWSENEPSSPWGTQPLQTRATNQTFYPMAEMPRNKDQVLPTVSLVLGILSIVLFCCYGGFPFGIAAIITGYLGYRNTDKDPEHFTGRGMAIAGIILGVVGFLGLIMLILAGVIGSIFS